ncbi:hypothetical protein BDN71DRAFT_1433921 [Pleurotus eryngii]|uniref:Uncharacterized protein n=1 Tax=Pleurotus eryngii TaxID=5323 RepID=A0A9P6DD56_PLEER|nr:hypothetical protein BDN71DRAFT_1433921 [Pleurotus eryngii]
MGALGGSKVGILVTAGGEVVMLGPVLAAGEVNTSSGARMTTLLMAGEGGTLSACSKAGRAAKIMGKRKNLKVMECLSTVEHSTVMVKIAKWVYGEPKQVKERIRNDNENLLLSAPRVSSYELACLGKIQEKVTETHLAAYMNQQVKTGA